MSTGWICSRCSASNAPFVAKCECTPAQQVAPQPVVPSDWDWVRPYIGDPLDPWRQFYPVYPRYTWMVTTTNTSETPKVSK